MKILTNGILCLVAGILLLGVIAENDKDKRRDMTMCFLAVMGTIVAHNTVM